MKMDTIIENAKNWTSPNLYVVIDTLKYNKEFLDTVGDSEYIKYVHISVKKIDWDDIETDLNYEWNHIDYEISIDNPSSRFSHQYLTKNRGWITEYSGALPN